MRLLTSADFQIRPTGPRRRSTAPPNSHPLAPCRPVVSRTNGAERRGIDGYGVLLTQLQLQSLSRVPNTIKQCSRAGRIASKSEQHNSQHNWAWSATLAEPLPATRLQRFRHAARDPWRGRSNEWAYSKAQTDNSAEERFH
ncbi:Hypothetical predicted protein [Cloeon dipterum]|uniref:Uncharacterized protein n=1 Tax=Cloeon dipterum TaxID=197152 RepID=A0A8S1C871_9INSE|nr:Hypothetical predicted protein [Cloeon dipterum]